MDGPVKWIMPAKWPKIGNRVQVGYNNNMNPQSPFDPGTADRAGDREPSAADSSARTPVVAYVQPLVEIRSALLKGFRLTPHLETPPKGAPSPMSLEIVARATTQALPWFSALLSESATHLPLEIRQALVLTIPLSTPLPPLSDFCDEMQSLCQASNMDLGRLQLEIPQTALTTDPEQARELFEDLAGIGFRIALGPMRDSVSSLSLIASLPLQSMSLARSLSQDLTGDPVRQRVARALIDLGRNLGLVTQAVGIEDGASLRLLDRLGCDQACGDYIAPPMDLASAGRWVAHRASTVERHRLTELHSLGLIDTPEEERFDRLTRLSQRIFGVDSALVSLIDEYRQWFKSHSGLEGPRESSRDIAFCDHAIRSSGVMVVEDAQLDIRFADNPFVTGPPHIRFYAGCPLEVSPGNRVGTLCLLDGKPRKFSDTDQQLLTDLAQLVVKEIRADILASTDPLTGLLNRRGFEERAADAIRIAGTMETRIALVFFDLDDLKTINDSLGHAAGDRAIKGFAQLLQASLRDSDLIARQGGDEFVALLINASEQNAAATIDRIRDAVDRFNATGGESFRLNFSMGCVIRDARANLDISSLLAEADRRMYLEKDKGE